jgi:hypothetical protein
MLSPPHFEIGSDYASYRPIGSSTTEGLINLVTAAIRYAGAQGVKRLLIDVTQLTGLPALSTADRYAMGERFAAAAAPGLKAVLVARPDMVDPHKFGVTVARNRGLHGNVVSSETEALAWLLEGQGNQPVNADKTFPDAAARQGDQDKPA